MDIKNLWAIMENLQSVRICQPEGLGSIPKGSTTEKPSGMCSTGNPIYYLLCSHDCPIQ